MNRRNEHEVAREQARGTLSGREPRTGSDAGPQRDQRHAAPAAERIDESGLAKDDPSRAPESGTP